MKCFCDFFAETETLWSQGPVTQDFFKIVFDSAEILTFQHFRVCSVRDEIRSTYAHSAMKFIPRMLSAQ
jgi:hypothetical protein